MQHGEHGLRKMEALQQAGLDAPSTLADVEPGVILPLDDLDAFYDD